MGSIQVAIPCKRGSLNDVIADETLGTNSVPESSMDVDTAATDGEIARRIAQKESVIEIDYSRLPKAVKEIADAESLNAALQSYMDRIAAINQEIESMAPNMKAVDRLDDVKERLRVTTDEYDASLVV